MRYFCRRVANFWLIFVMLKLIEFVIAYSERLYCNFLTCWWGISVGEWQTWAGNPPLFSSPPGRACPGRRAAQGILKRIPSRPEKSTQLAQKGSTYGGIMSNTYNRIIKRIPSCPDKSTQLAQTGSTYADNWKVTWGQEPMVVRSSVNWISACSVCRNGLGKNCL